MKNMRPFSEREAKSFIDETAPSLGCGDNTYTPDFPKGYDNVSIVTRAVEDGYSYGYSIIYIVWKNSKGMQKRELANTRSSKDYLYYKDLKVEDGKLSFILQVSGTYSGNPSKHPISVDLNDLD